MVTPYIGDLNTHFEKVNTDTQLCEFLKKYPQFILKAKNLIISKLKNISFDENAQYSEFLCLFFSNPYNEDLYDILLEYFNNIPDHLLNIFNSDIVLFIRYSKMKEIYENIEMKSNINFELICSYAMDIYIPSENPNKISSILNKILINEFSNMYVYEISDTDKDELDEEEIRQLVYLFKIIKELFISDDYKKEFIEKYHFISWYSNMIFKDIAKVIDRYKKYYNEESFTFTYDLLFDLNYYKNIDAKKISIYKTIENIMTYLNVPVISSKDKIILNGILNDILLICEFTCDSYNFSENVKLVNEILLLPEIKSSKIEEDHSLENITYMYTPSDGLDYATEAYKKNSSTMHKTQHNIYKAYKNYKNAEDKIDSQLTQAAGAIKKMAIGDIKTEIIEGKKYTVLGILKKVLGTAAVFSFGKVAGIIALVVRWALRKTITHSERQKVILMLEAELEIIKEKIDDARGDGDRQAKYAMMRTKTELENAIYKVKLGLEADNNSIKTGTKFLNKSRGGV